MLSFNVSPLTGSTCITNKSMFPCIVVKPDWFISPRQRIVSRVKSMWNLLTNSAECAAIEMWIKYAARKNFDNSTWKTQRRFSEILVIPIPLKSFFSNLKIEISIRFSFQSALVHCTLNCFSIVSHWRVNIHFCNYFFLRKVNLV